MSTETITYTGETSGYLSIPKPEWWTPSEFCHAWVNNPTWPGPFRLSSIDHISPLTGDQNRMAIRIVMKGLVSRLNYDTPEHRDEDYARLKEALNI